MVSKKTLAAIGIIGGIAVTAAYLAYAERPKPQITCPAGTYLVRLKNNYSVPANVFIGSQSNSQQSTVIYPGSSQELCLAPQTNITVAYGMISIPTPSSNVEIGLNGPGMPVTLRYLP